MYNFRSSVLTVIIKINSHNHNNNVKLKFVIIVIVTTRFVIMVLMNFHDNNVSERRVRANITHVTSTQFSLSIELQLFIDYKYEF